MNKEQKKFERVVKKRIRAKRIKRRKLHPKGKWIEIKHEKPISTTAGVSWLQKCVLWSKTKGILVWVQVQKLLSKVR